MRTVADYGLLHLPNEPAAFDSLARAELLTTVRYEPVFRERLGSATLDLLFERGDDILIIHGVAVDMIALASLEGPVLLWPARTALETARAQAIEARIFPWLRTLVRGRSAPSEEIRSFSPSPAFARARELGLRGAAPLARTLVAAAPFVYARRFARGAHVRIACADAYHAAAVLRDIAASIEIIEPACGSPDRTFAKRWYGDWSTPPADGAPALAVVDDAAAAEAAGVPFVVATRANERDAAVVIPEPIPNDLLFTFDAADAPEAGRFAVRATDRAARPVRAFSAAPALGGSHGDICLVLRDDAMYAADAQTDEAATLARRLRAEGLSVEQVTSTTDERIARADLVHVFGAACSLSTEAAIAAARAAGRPYVVSLEPLAPLEAACAEDALLAMLQLGADTASQETFRDAYFRNALRIDGVATALPADEVQRRDRRFGAACAGATAVLLAPHDDVAAFCRRFGEVAPERVRSAGVLLDPEPAEDAVAAYVPSGPFLLMHAPLVRRSNLHLAVAALAGAPYGIVVAGPVSDVDLAISLRRNAGSDVVFLPDPAPGAVAALYRRAAAFLEPSFRPAGAGRIVRAAQCGALPLVPRTSPLAPLLDASLHVNCATFERLAEDVGAAMARTGLAVGAALAAARFAALADQRTAFADVLHAYAQAQAPA